ncbi:roadblock/LC7 domain-containing protein [Geopsychrobacter electrodiphilus]|uniref:roadblock/LC7 domain-containing protein n=1 Tax=Geopsychrobacter electrodiphilus TaxID=225196 RepID=UPI00036B3C9D|nr:roadblock/LC7 domain-containing protein [Geopsychrobacter electrodiphilus]
MFRKLLEKMVKDTPGGVGIVLMGYDGIAIDQFFLDVGDVDLQLVAIEYSNVVKEIHHTAEILGTGTLQEVTIKTGRFYVIIHALTDEYFVALTIRREGNLGKGRYIVLRDAPALNQALV